MTECMRSEAASPSQCKADDDDLHRARYQVLFATQPPALQRSACSGQSLASGVAPHILAGYTQTEFTSMQHSSAPVQANQCQCIYLFYLLQAIYLSFADYKALLPPFSDRRAKVQTEDI